jgi:hypothetical protein
MTEQSHKLYRSTGVCYCAGSCLFVWSSDCVACSCSGSCISICVRVFLFVFVYFHLCSCTSTCVRVFLFVFVYFYLCSCTSTCVSCTSTCVRVLYLWATVQNSPDVHKAPKTFLDFSTLNEKFLI